MECGEKETMIHASINCKVRYSKYEVRLDPGNKEKGVRAGGKERELAHLKEMPIWKIERSLFLL